MIDEDDILTQFLVPYIKAETYNSSKSSQLNTVKTLLCSQLLAAVEENNPQRPDRRNY